MNYSYRNNNEVEYCSRVIYCLRPNTNSRKNPWFSQSQDTTRDPPCIIVIYLEYT